MKTTIQISIDDKRSLLRQFPDIKLSYEKYVHKKVVHSEMISAIPQGPKHFAWFTTFRDQYTCLLLEPDVQCKHSNGFIQIKDVYPATTCFGSSLSLGTILYGTTFLHLGNPFFCIEDIFYIKGNDLRREQWQVKLTHIQRLLEKDLPQTSYNNQFLVFGLPSIASSDEDMERKRQRVSYPLSDIQYRNGRDVYLLPYEKYNLPIAPSLSIAPSLPIASTLHDVSSMATKPSYTKGTNATILLLKPDIQNDVYHVFAANDCYLGVAAIPDYKTSVMLNKLFRNIKENQDLDKLEESDDEEEFENPNMDKFVRLDMAYSFECRYHKRHHKWFPVKVADPKSIVSSQRDAQNFVHYLLHQKAKM